jgi:DNA polymerase III sliding clamp (beta) subunit (PCNA family)
MIIKGTKEESALIRWVQKAQSKDSARPVLEGMLVENGNILACDGFRIHAAPTPSALVDGKGVYQGKVPAGDFIAELEEICEATPYPDYAAIMPSGEPEFHIHVDPKFLVEALAGFDSTVELRFFGKTQPMELTGTFKDDTNLYVILMPKNGSKDDSKPWRPGK